MCDKGTPIPPAVRRAAQRIRLAAFDVDGVMTDGRLFLAEDGSEYRCFHVRDGLGLTMLSDSDCQIAVITARSSRAVAERMRSLGIVHVYQGEQDKEAVMQRLLNRLDLDWAQACYTGDDLIDLAVMRRVGLSIAVADADPRVRQQAHWVVPQAGGCGAVRSVCELLLHPHASGPGQSEGY